MGSSEGGDFCFATLADYTSLDYSKVNTIVQDNSFKVIEDIEITGLVPDQWYHPSIKVYKINEDRSTEEVASTDMTVNAKSPEDNPYMYFLSDESGNAHVLATLDYLELSAGRYIVSVVLETTSDNPKVVGAHHEPDDLRETFVIYEKTYYGFESYIESPGDLIEDLYGRIEPSSNHNHKTSPNTGDDNSLLTLFHIYHL